MKILEEFPATHLQRWHFDASPDGSNNNIPLVIRLSGVDTATLQGAIDDLVMRHEALRTRLAEVRGDVVQQVYAPGGVELVETQPSTVSGELDEGMRVVEGTVDAPFVVRGGELVRARRCQLGLNESVLVLVAHHAVCDGWSAGVIHRDLTEFIRARCEGRPPRLPRVELQLGDYAVWEGEQSLGAAGDYWRERLSSGHPRLGIGKGLAADDLPGRLRVAPLRTLGAETVQRLAALALRSRTTVASVLGATVVASLAAYVEGEITVGVITANRDRRELREVVGDVAQRLPVRVGLGRDRTFTELLECYDWAMRMAREHARPMGVLASLLRENPQRRTGPLFDVAVNYLAESTDLDVMSGSLGDPQVTVGEAELPLDKVMVSASRWWNVLPVVHYLHRPRRDGTIGGYVNFNVNALDRADTNVLVGRLAAVIAGVAEDAGARISELT